MQNNSTVFHDSSTKQFQVGLYEKQRHAYWLLEQPYIEELLFGGAAGGGKSYFGCVWLVLSCIRYPGSRWLLARNKLTDLSASTLVTLLDFLTYKMGMEAEKDFIYRPQQGKIVFKFNKSEIILRQLEITPSDPHLSRLGSAEFTGAFIDQAEEIDAIAYDIVKSRLRYRNGEFGIPGRVLMSCNPGENFLRGSFYNLWKKNTLPIHKAFVPALPDENPSLPPDYIQRLEKLDDEELKQKLRYGNWDFDTDDGKLISGQWFDDAVRSVEEIALLPLKKRIAVDVSREGPDRTIAILRQGDIITHIHPIDIYINKNGDISGAIADRIIKFAAIHDVHYKDITIDAINVGAGVYDTLIRRGFFVRPFKASEKPLPTDEQNFVQFVNRRDQVYWNLRYRFQKQMIAIDKKIDPELVEQLKEELIAHRYEIKDKSIKINKKDEVRAKIRRSPDISDALAMVFDDFDEVNNSTVIRSSIYNTTKKRGLGFYGKRF